MVFKALALLKHRIESEIRERKYAKKQRLDTLAVHRVLSNNELVDKVAGVYLNGRKPMSGKDLFLSGKEITLNCATFYGGTFENCKFVNVGSDEALLKGSHIIVTSSNFYGIKFTKEDNDYLRILLCEELKAVKNARDLNVKNLRDETDPIEISFREDAIEAGDQQLYHVEQMLSKLEDEKQQTAVHATEGGN